MYNSTIEKSNRFLLNRLRAVLITSNLPKYLEAKAILIATYLYNRTFSSFISF